MMRILIFIFVYTISSTFATADTFYSVPPTKNYFIGTTLNINLNNKQNPPETYIVGEPTVASPDKKIIYKANDGWELVKFTIYLGVLFGAAVLGALGFRADDREFEKNIK